MCPAAADDTTNKNRPQSPRLVIATSSTVGRWIIMPLL